MSTIVLVIAIITVAVLLIYEGYNISMIRFTKTIIDALNNVPADESDDFIRGVLYFNEKMKEIFR